MAANSSSDKAIRDIIARTVEHTSSLMDGKIDLVLSKQEEVSKQIGKISDALYDPESGLFMRTKMTESKVENLSEKLDCKADKTDLQMVTQAIQRELKDCHAKNNFFGKLWLNIVMLLASFLLGLATFYLTSAPQQKSNQEVKLQKEILPAIKIKEIN